LALSAGIGGHNGSFLPGERNIVLVGRTGTGKSHLAIAITASVVRAGARSRYFTPSIWSPGSRAGPASAKLARSRARHGQAKHPNIGGATNCKMQMLVPLAHIRFMS